MVKSDKVQAETPETTGYYAIKCKCDNCGYEGETQIKKGEKVPNKILCPNCECYAASKYIPVKIDYNKEKDKWVRDNYPWIPYNPIVINPPDFPKPFEIWCGVV